MTIKTIITAAALFAGMFATAQNREISFEHSSWKTILEKAKKENKLVYLDAYTSWCGPCKWMAKNVFTNDTVADYYNSTFVNAKIDMEKGEGVDIAKRYAIRAYPTMLFIDGDGNIVHRVCGSQPAADFITTGKDALIPEKQLATYTKKFNESKVDIAFASKYLSMLEAGCQSNERELDHFILGQDEAALTSDAGWMLISQHASDVDGAAFHYLEDHRDAYSKKHTADSVTSRIEAGYSQKLRRIRDEKQLQRLTARMQSLQLKNADKISRMGYINYYMMSQKWKDFAAATIEYLDKYSDLAPAEMNNLAWTFYEHVDDKEQLAKMAGYTKKALEQAPQYMIEDTYASLLYKLGRKDEARKAAEAAIESAKKEGANASETEELLKKIDKLK